MITEAKIPTETTRLVDQFGPNRDKCRHSNTTRSSTVPVNPIESTDREIDQHVYQLYGLTDDEIRIVEEATPQ